LVLVESDDPLEAGLEIMCQPPGKKLATLSLLVGGEQTLTALALIFGVFLANPAPICVLDEVDAPLDDANVTRFCDLLDEMTRRTETRFLIITHHAVTMARMDRLFGVTMQEQGVSQLVSVDLKKAEALVASLSNHRRWPKWPIRWRKRTGPCAAFALEQGKEEIGRALFRISGHCRGVDGPQGLEAGLARPRPEACL
jgi:energy-coupling factor transporter ATP-binding protein EcfA2